MYMCVLLSLAPFVMEVALDSSHPCEVVGINIKACVHATIVSSELHNITTTTQQLQQPLR